ncbi:ISAs1 family transposase [Paenibacillus sp. YN15]|uniref:ISAs1 family transposase n=1 Tax=Paenibacillus sp. YN15 TaxID=1742774 RepID=UPI000DCBD887|nr:ISAs1 family transposase [Paenibacillus sp. YN15]RAV01486.1 ISAs1 family transposase [Paenibacillus sp. YN15]
MNLEESEMADSTRYQGSFFNYFQMVQDPRQAGKVMHKLMDILFIGVCASLCRCEDWEAMELWAHEREEWLRQYIGLPNGIPSEQTLERVFDLISPKQVEICFIEWMKEIRGQVERDVIAVDGKTMRSTGNEAEGKKAIHVVSAYSTQYGLVLGEKQTQEKSNEITVVPELLKRLMIKGCIVTVDALNTQKEIARQIVKENKADYVLALKGNHRLVHNEVKEYFADAMQKGEAGTDYEIYSTTEKGHGRIEKRIYRFTTQIDWLTPRKEWEKLQGIGMVTRIVEEHGQTRKEEAYYLCSITKVELFAQAVRSHWGVESMHWHLDVTFGEDGYKTKERNRAANVAVLKRIALNVVKQDKSKHVKRSLNKRRFIASMNTSYVDELLSQYVAAQPDEA